MRVHRVSAPRAWQALRVIAFSRAAERAAPRGAYDVVYSLARTASQDVYRAGAGSHADFMDRQYTGFARTLRRFSPRHRALLGLERAVFADTSQVVQCNSEMVRDEIRQRYGVSPQRLPVIWNGVDAERFRAPVGAGAQLRAELGVASEPVWLFAGSGFARKGLDTALRALAERQTEGCLWVAGADDPTPWKKLATALGIAPRVRFLGHRRDLAPAFQAADALLLPTRYDAFANVCLEAAAAGLPCVTSGANGAAQLLRDAALVVEDPEDVSGFAKALDALAEARVRERLGEAARALAGQRSWDTHVTALRELFARVRG